VISDFKEDIRTVVAESAVGVVRADNTERAEVQLLQEGQREDTGQQSARIVEVAGKPGKEGVVSVLGVMYFYALIENRSISGFKSNPGPADANSPADSDRSDCNGPDGALLCS
jgi:hypothetical protein